MAVVDDGAGSSRGRAASWQLSLGGLIVLVLAAGLAAGVARHARGVWGTRTLDSKIAAGAGPGARSVPVPVERTAGLVLEIAGVFLMVILARGLIGLVRVVRSAERPVRMADSWTIVWRVGALGFLLWFLSQESAVLRIDFANEVPRARQVFGSNDRYLASQALLPVCGLLAILGLSLGMGAGFLVPASSAVRRRPYWLFVVLAAVIAVLLVTIPGDYSLIPYLILNALEAVTNAMQHRLDSGPGLSTRLIHAGMVASVAAAACLALALAVARDFERLRRGGPWMTSRVGRVVRLILLAAAAAGGLTIVNVTIPAIHPCFAQGFRDVISAVDMGMIVGGFGMLAAGLAARSVVGPPPGAPPVWRTKLSVGLGLGFLGLILVYALSSFPTMRAFDPTLPAFASRSIAFCQEFLAHFLPDTITNAVSQWFKGDLFPWTLTAVAVVGFVFELAVRGDSISRAPFERLAESPGRAGPFVWLTLGLTVVCLSAMPTLIVAGQAILHLRMNGADILGKGWAN